jgi:DNA-binding beta-propeller fold protein YncE
MTRSIFIILFLSTIFIACKKNNSDKNTFVLQKPGVFISNEGNFTYGNASLSYIDFTADTIYNYIFKKSTTYPLGDVAQSMSLINGKLYIVINNSGKIYIINPNNANYIGKINKLTSPRYIIPIDSTKAYVSDLYSKSVSIINLKNNKITGNININAPSEQMLAYSNYIFVVCWNKSHKLVKINKQTNQVADSINITYQPNSLVIDKYNRLWVLSDGGLDPDTNKDQKPALTCINPDNMQIIKKFEFASKSASPTHLCINYKKDTLFFLNSSWSNTSNIVNAGVFRMSVDAKNLPAQAFIPEKKELFYSLAVNNNSQIFVSDAIDYVQPGIILKYSSNGNLIKKYQAAIIPGNFLFVK